MTVTFERIGYGPWELLSNTQKSICVAESVLEFRRCVDLDLGRVTWIKPTGYGEIKAPQNWPPDYSNDSSAVQEIKRKFDSWTVTKYAPRHYVATVVTENGQAAQASGTSENDALLHACVIAKGVCV